ncbi:MAG: hypothetical protein BGO55_00465 [Sphingobacteriales bacterium 50-39]|nr:helix-turn-helix transcriptional regulator [Sphingobacteriales bacterium]OJW53587.1 MAG: hypothetical protein BGO55_00465 [Sphingobacteriales bacterium 50-39]
MEGADSQQIIQQFGENLEKIRMAKGLSLRDLAHIADIDHSTIHRIEKGIANPMLTMIITLANALEVDPAEMLAPFRGKK